MACSPRAIIAAAPRNSSVYHCQRELQFQNRRYGWRKNPTGHCVLRADRCQRLENEDFPNFLAAPNRRGSFSGRNTSAALPLQRSLTAQRHNFPSKTDRFTSWQAAVLFGGGPINRGARAKQRANSEIHGCRFFQSITRAFPVVTASRPQNLGKVLNFVYYSVSPLRGEVARVW